MSVFNNGERVVLLTNNKSRPLAESIADKLGRKLDPCRVDRFIDGEVWVEIGPDVPVRNSWVFIIGSYPAPSDNMMELLLMVDAARRAAAHQIILVSPYSGYGRQDRNDNGHEPISAAIIPKIFEFVGVKQFITMDVHSGQAPGFVNNPFKNLWGRKLLLMHIMKNVLKIPADSGLNHSVESELNTLNDLFQRLAFLGPDAGAYKVCAYYAGMLKCVLLGALKMRPEPDKSQMVLVGGDKVEGRDVVMLDDLSSTGVTLCDGSVLVKKKGAGKVIAAVTHATFSKDAISRLEDSMIDLVVTTDTVPLARESKKIQVISVAGEFARAIRYVVTGESVSSLARESITQSL